MRTISILILSVVLLAACGSGHIRRGDAAYKEMSFKKAAYHYEKALSQKNSPLIHAKAAEAYVRMNDTKKAEGHYQIALLSEEAPSEMKFRYAQMLLANGKQTEGRKWIEKYLAENPDDALAKEWTSENVSAGEFTEFDPSRIKVEVVPLSGYSNTFAAYPSNDGIYFVGEKDPTKGDKINPWNGNSFLDVYHVSKVVGNEWIDPKAVKGDMNKVLHDGPISLTNDGQIAYTTRSAMDDANRHKLDEKEINQLKIVRLSLGNDGNWKMVGDLPLNQPNSSNMHPSICIDNNTLFFASDREGGYGGSDLYMAVFDGQKWSEPQNLGAEINTSRNEGFPFALYKDTLFFASDGHGGMGGLDIFISIFDGQAWSHPRNLKAPINTNFDDFSMYRYEGGMSGYFSSNRSGRDAIYKWQVNDPEFLIVGKVVDVDDDPVANAKVVLTEGNQRVDSTKTNKTGDFAMPLDWQKEYEVSGTHKTQKTDTATASTVDKIASETIEVELKLEGPQFWVHGVVIDRNTKKRIIDVKVELLKGADSALLSDVQSDKNGEFVFKLNRNEDYKLHGVRKNTFTRKEELSTQGMKESKTFEVILELEEVEVAKPYALNNIYYDYNKHDIRKDAVGDLENLLSFMQQNPSAKIELSAHTDCRGTNKYNNSLSEKRAKSAMNYLINHGIKKSRISFIGYGETKLVNECKDGVQCSEEKHQENRRTEFRVLQLD